MNPPNIYESGEHAIFYLNSSVNQGKGTLTNLEINQEVSKIGPRIVSAKDQTQVVS